jgi:hypothetical protein
LQWAQEHAKQHRGASEDYEGCLICGFYRLAAMYWVRERNSRNTDITHLADDLWRLSLPADWDTTIQHDVIDFVERFTDALLANADEYDKYVSHTLYIYIYIFNKKQNETKLILITV